MTSSGRLSVRIMQLKAARLFPPLAGSPFAFTCPTRPPIRFRFFLLLEFISDEATNSKKTKLKVVVCEYRDSQYTCIYLFLLEYHQQLPLALLDLLPSKKRKNNKCRVLLWSQFYSELQKSSGFRYYPQSNPPCPKNRYKFLKNY